MTLLAGIVIVLCAGGCFTGASRTTALKPTHFRRTPTMSITRDTARAGTGLALLIGGALSAGLLLLAGAPAAYAARSEPADAETTVPITSVDHIHDDADVINDQRVVDALNELTRFGEHESVQIAVYTSNNVAADSYDDDITALIASENDPLVMDGSGLVREDVIVITLSPEARKLGVYTREGSALDSETAVADTTSAMTPYARDADWDNAVFVGASTYLETVGVAARPTKDPETQYAERVDSLAKIAIIPLVATAFILGPVFLGRLLVDSLRTKAQLRRIAQRYAELSDQDAARLKRDWENAAELKDRPSTARWLKSISVGEYRDAILKLSATPQVPFRELRPFSELDPELLFDPRSRDDIDTLLLLTFGTPEERVATWNRELDKLDEDEIAGLRRIDEEIAEIELPEKAAKKIRKQAATALNQIDKTIKEAKRHPQRVDLVASMNTIVDVLSEMHDDAKNVIRNLDESEREHMRPRRAFTDSHSQNDASYLIPIYIATAFVASSAYHHSTSSSASASPSYTAPTSYTSPMGGGGFSGGSSSF